MIDIVSLLYWNDMYIYKYSKHVVGGKFLFIFNLTLQHTDLIWII